MKSALDENRLKEIIAYLQTTHDEDDGFKVYDLLESLGIDKNYIINHENIVDKNIEDMSAKNLKTMYTFIVRGERFCRGHIASYINDGTLLKLAQRHLQLLNK